MLMSDTTSKTSVRVWVYISKQFVRKDIYQEILIGLRNIAKKDGGMMKKIKELPDGDLPIEICKILKENECLVVLDDMWRNRDWDTLKPAFEGIQSSGSKILITTRDQSLVKYADMNGYHHSLGFLSEEASWKLLRQTSFQGSENMGENSSKMESLGRETLKHCNGLPLAIIALGGLLSTKKTIEEWENVQRNIPSYLMSDMEEVSNSKGLSAVLELSFYELPVYLKPCFLYLGLFPEGFEIITQRLYHLWEAEGLVTRRDGFQGVSLDDIAESYLSQLVQRSIVQVEKRWPNGMIKSCRLHDVVRDLCLKKCKEVNFLDVVEHGSSYPTTSSSTISRKLRHCAIYLRGPESLEGLNKDPFNRSLLVFPCGGEHVRNTRNFMSSVRVLDLQEIKVQGPRMELACFIHLRYLSLKGASIAHFPSHMWSCKHLETLDLRYSNLESDSTLSNKFWKLERLRHLYLPPYIKLRGSKKLVLETKQLQQMETFKNFDVNTCYIEDLGKMSNLRVFSIQRLCCLDRESLEVLLKSPVFTTKRLVNPLRLNINARVLNDDPTIMATRGCDLNVDGMRIYGRIEVALNAEAQLFPHSLTRVRLEECEIGEEGIRVLEMLPRLKKLRLHLNAISVSKMRCSNGGFTQLFLLILSSLDTLEEWEVEEGALPNLLYLQIFECKRLKLIPEGLPSSVDIECLPCVKGIENYKTCPHVGKTS